MRYSLIMRELLSYIPSVPRSLRQKKPLGFTLKDFAVIFGIGALSLGIFMARDSLEGLHNLGYLGGFLVMLISSATLVLSAPGMLVVFALGATDLNPLALGLAAGIGAAIGELTGYLAGYTSNRAITTTKLYHQMEERIRRHAGWTIALLAFIPNPLFDITGIAAGALKVSWRRFIVSAAIGKSLRMILVAYAGKLSLDWAAKLF